MLLTCGIKSRTKLPLLARAGDFNYKFCSLNYAMKNKTSTPILLHKHSVISCAIAKGGALRERGNVRTSGGSISLVGNGIAYNVRPLADVRDLNTALVNVVMSPAYWQAVVGRS